MTYLVVGFITIVLVLGMIAVIAAATDTNMVDLIFGIFFFIIGGMALIGASIEVGKLVIRAFSNG